MRLLFGAAITILSVTTTSAHGIPVPSGASAVCLNKTGAEFRTCVERACDDTSCLAGIIVGIVRRSGPEAAMSAIDPLLASPALKIAGNGHDLAHVVGRTIASDDGIGIDAFNRCPTNYFYGCQHGFFEEALVHADSPVAAAVSICGDNPALTAGTFLCYHGVGHGMLMARANDLDRTLDDCASLPTDIARNGCSQGVFMELMNAWGRGEVAIDPYSSWDPLAPCSSVDPRSQWGCYTNHAVMLLRHANGDAAQALRWCRNAPDGLLEACAGPFGRMAVTPERQKQVLGIETIDAAVLAPKLMKLCDALPEASEICVAGAATKLADFDHADRAIALCAALPTERSGHCFIELARQLRFLGKRADGVCTGLDDDIAEECLTAIPYAPWPTGDFETDESWWSRVATWWTSLFADEDTSPDRSANVVVRCTDEGFSPSTITVHAGEAVRWEGGGEACWPASNPHPTHEGYPGFDASKPLAEGDAWTFAIEKPGHWPYHDHLRPWFTGTVVTE